MSQTAIVIGSTGLIGSALVRKLANSEQIARIITITRRPVPPIASKVENHVVDFDNLVDHEPLFNADLLFCCLGTTKKQVGSYAAQRLVDVDYPLVAGELAKQQGVGHALVVSSYGADKHSRSEYLKMKGDLEDGFVKLGFESLTLLRPSLLLGHRTHFRLGEKMASWLLPVITWLPGLKKYRPIAGEQVANKMFMLSLDENKSPVKTLSLDQIFN